MLGFSRTKWVGVEKPDSGTYFAHGILEDNIYGLELDVTVKAPEFIISGISGKMRRTTTPVCHEALPVLNNALNLCISSPDFISTVNRHIGREGCRHFANLLIECCDTILRNAFFESWAELKKNNGEKNSDICLREALDNFPGLRDRCYGFNSERLKGENK